MTLFSLTIRKQGKKFIVNILIYFSFHVRVGHDLGDHPAERNKRIEDDLSAEPVRDAARVMRQ